MVRAAASASPALDWYMPCKYTRPPCSGYAWRSWLQPPGRSQTRPAWLNIPGNRSPPRFRPCSSGWPVRSAGAVPPGRLRPAFLPPGSALHTAPQPGIGPPRHPPGTASARTARARRLLRTARSQRTAGIKAAVPGIRCASCAAAGCPAQPEHRSPPPPGLPSARAARRAAPAPPGCLERARAPFPPPAGRHHIPSIAARLRRRPGGSATIPGPVLPPPRRNAALRLRLHPPRSAPSRYSLRPAPGPAAAPARPTPGRCIFPLCEAALCQ